ncbi:MAG: hypothetical protein QOH16_641 [Gaiellaceae bacterium]|nr:hypothetical protein [Gaiellaceae bacterium]
MQAHIVPRFHLGRFASPPGRNGSVYVIDKRTGRSFREPVKNACTATDFYVIEDKAGNESAVIEDMLQKLESYCARRIEQLVKAAGKPSDNDRYTLAMYVVLTATRTPRMREHLRWVSDTLTLARFRSTLEADPPWQRMRAALYAEMPDDEAERLRQRMIKEVDSGNLAVEFPQRYYVISTMEYLTHQAEIAADMSWTVMRTPDDREFVIGDNAVTMHDPTLAASNGPVGNALASSRFAETVLPLDRHVAVRLTFGDDDWTDAEIESELLDELNLRSYAWADTAIYGSSQAHVVAVREHARRHPTLPAKFAPRRGGLLIENDYPLVGGGHRRDVVVETPRSVR